jgi:hypothetical protein
LRRILRGFSGVVFCFAGSAARFAREGAGEFPPSAFRLI